MDPEWTFAERQVHDPYDLPRHFRRIGVVWFQAGQALQRLVGDAGVGARFVFRGSRRVGRLARMREMIGPLGEGARAP